ncbi:hypothetical protein K432DRAFT_424866 [Lepidopterella palustris CBS 459.81]|uniref:Flo11 n=1 Tax=Lepidopterella palustris CBS 459.81 TaxID=1314670 RepID=A0A8E2JGD7_9PEZI|nr:hypothetical protein K432DRAFT_424866 [Lepidopterella palustris CBS 459.81]
MHRHSRSEAGELASPRSSRAPSFSSDRPSLAGSTSFQIPSNVRPAPAYIAASVASQIVTDHHNAQLRQDFDLDDESSPFLVNALFSDEALCLLNAFLDHLLFSFLSAARSPSLIAIRPAISDVLKPRLAREAMATADEELQGLLAGEDDEEFPALQNGQDQSERWDVETVWKRTRLRIMVYTRLGELEDEDEERYVQQERGLSLDDGSNEELGLVSWASAIFLTSVIEYIAEQTLVVSGQAAFARISAKMMKDAQRSTEGEEVQLERIIVEEFDVEKVALNSTLGRLWRTWRKRVRSPIVPLTSSSPRGSITRGISSVVSPARRGGSLDTTDDSMIDGQNGSRAQSLAEVPEHEVTETDIAANIPLPITANDIAEIEVPGLAQQLDEESSGTQTPTLIPSRRPNSFIMLSSTQHLLDGALARRSSRERPVSMPILGPTPFTFASNSIASDSDFVTPMERMSEDQSHIGLRHSLDEEESDGVNPGILAGALAGATSLAAAAFATIVGTSTSNEDAVEMGHEDRVEMPVLSGDDREPEVLQSKRLSISASGPPGIVRTYSVRSNRSSSALQTLEPKHYLKDSNVDDDVEDPEAIGVARTSNIPIPATPSPPSESTTNGHTVTSYKEQHGDESMADNEQITEKRVSRRLSVSPPVPRKTPSPVEMSMTSEKSIPRKEIPPPRSSSTSRSPALAALQESSSWPNITPETQVAENRASDVTRTRSQSSGHQSAAARSRDVLLPEKSAKRKSNDSSRSGTRSRSGTAEGYPTERASLQRVSSSSSTTRSTSTSILHSSKDSDSSIGRPRGLSTRFSEEDRQREFDSLVRGEETVKYTLTPQSMRDMDESPVVKKVESPKAATQVSVYPRVNSGQPSSLGSQQAQQTAQQAPLRSISKGKSSVSSESTAMTSARPPSTNTATRKNGLAAREPRIQTESLRDFADFIRSTGPHDVGSYPVQPFITSTPSSSRSPGATSSSISSLGRKISGRHGTGHQPKTVNGADEGPSVRSKIHMEPRSPAGQGNGNADLIDFIRQGPPNSQDGQHRIPRAVAPFRSTVDSDEFNRMLNDRSPDNSHVESTYGSQVSTDSKHSAHASTNSRTGLLPAPNVVQPAYSNTPQHLAGSFSAPEPQVVRKRRRVKDPYAIDSDDEDEDLLTALPKSKRQEESLIDFLRSVEPPPQNDPKPLATNGAVAAAARTRAINGTSQASSSTNGTSSNASAAAWSSSSTAHSGLPSSSGNSVMISSTIAASVPKSNRPRPQARGAGARDARATARSDMNDLADFLRTSGPQEPAAQSPGNTIKKDEGKRMPTRFWRKKASIDMS